MNSSHERKKYFSNKPIFKGVIRFLLFRYGPQTAKQIQIKLGLKQQTTYNYLNELVDEGRIEVKYEKLEKRSNLTRAYYYHKQLPFFPDPEEMPYTDRIMKASRSVENLVKQVRSGIESSLGAILEIKAAIDRMTDKEVEEYVKCDPIVWGFFTTTMLLTDEEYSELQIEFKELLNKLDNKWVNEHEKDVHSGNVFTFMFYKAIPYSE
ncbi:MAG: hypothetical protein ACFFB5_10195 [Promethearchaeota archaeon]